MIPQEWVALELEFEKNDTFYLPLNFYYVLQVSLFANGKQIYEYQLWSIQIPVYKLCLKIVKNVSFCKKIVLIQQFLSDFVHLFFSKTTRQRFWIFEGVQSWKSPTEIRVEPKLEMSLKMRFLSTVQLDWNNEYQDSCGQQVKSSKNSGTEALVSS